MVACPYVKKLYKPIKKLLKNASHKSLKRLWQKLVRKRKYLQVEDLIESNLEWFETLAEAW